MKSLRIAVYTLMILTAVAAFAVSDAQKSFDQLKTLAGSWEGKNSMGEPLQVSYRLTGAGSALMSEIVGHGHDMITMFNLDGPGRLLMTHYCSAGNQPRMVGTMSPDGKTVTFNFLDATNLISEQKGHMQSLVVTMIDPDHHTEDWNFIANDGKTQHQEHFELQRQK
jgi:hypothetical protein